MKSKFYRRHKKILTTLQKIEEEKKCGIFDFHPKFGFQFGSIFKKHNISLGFYNNYNINKCFSKCIEKGNDDASEKAGVYKIDCKTCGKVYVGQTYRSLKIRSREHANCVKKEEMDRLAV